MKNIRTRNLSTALLVYAIAAAGALGPVSVPAQDAPKKGTDVKPERPPGEVPPPTGQPGAPGGMGMETDVQANAMNDADVAAQIDLTLAELKTLADRSKALSASFADLATLHEGADKSEILMMKRMSDSMQAMSAELQTSLMQYKKLLEEETVSESGAMRGEVRGLKTIMDGMARQVNSAVETLQSLQMQLGQG
jgi:hypothetical protein